MEKKGLSEVITALVLILLGLVAIGIVWVVVANTISQGSEEVELGRFTIDMEIENVVVNPNSIDVTLTRGAGQGSVEGIKVVISDGVNSQSTDVDLVINEYEKRTVNVAYLGITKTVSIAPLLNTASGSTSTGSITDTYEISDKEAIQSSPNILAWYKFEGNTNDEKETYNGVNSGTTFTNGKFGLAATFSGTNYINVSGILDSPNPSTGFSISGWIKTTQTRLAGILSKNNVYQQERFFLYLDNHSSPNAYLDFDTGVGGIGTYSHLNGTTIINDGNWHFFTVTWGPTNGKRTYLNGNLDSQNLTQTTIMQSGSAYPFQIGVDLWFFTAQNFLQGQLDEIMVFNKELSSEEVQALYNLNLN